MSTCNGDQFVNGYVNRVAQWPALRRPRPAFAFWQITIKNSFFSAGNHLSTNFPINHGSAQGRTASGAVQGCEGTAQWPLSQADPALGCPAHATETSACPPSGSHFARQSQPPS